MRHPAKADLKTNRRISGSRKFALPDIKLQMFTAYFDASGTEKGDAVLAVGGFLATAERWGRFEKEWLDCLRRNSLDYFRTSEFNASQGGFKIGWRGNEKRRIALISDLVEIIKNNVDRKFGVIVTMDSLQSFSRKQKEEWHICAYSLAGLKVASMVRQWAKAWSGPVPELVFEEGDKGRNNLEILLRQDGFLNTQFRPKKERTNKQSMIVKAAIPLQAADLMAFELFDPMRKLQRDGYLLNLKRTFQELDKINGELGVIRQPYTKLLAMLNESDSSQIIIPPPGYEQR